MMHTKQHLVFSKGQARARPSQGGALHAPVEPSLKDIEAGCLTETRAFIPADGVAYLKLDGELTWRPVEAAKAAHGNIVINYGSKQTDELAKQITDAVKAGCATRDRRPHVVRDDHIGRWLKFPLSGRAQVVAADPAMFDYTVMFENNGKLEHWMRSDLYACGAVFEDEQ